MRKKLLALSLGLLFSTASQATDDQSIWVSTTFQSDFGGSNYVGFLELQPRVKNDNRDLAQFIIRPFFGYKITKNLVASLGYAWQGEYDETNGFDLATHDIVEQVQWTHNFSSPLNFQYRFRLEQRFFEDADLSHRMRHRFRLQYSVPDTKFFVVGFDELFVYFNSLNNSRMSSTVQAGINQNRSYLGVGYKVTPYLNIDTGYQLQYVNNQGKEDFYNHVWLTNINFNF
jgi:Protein of unknown function (DUF2490)